MHLLIPYIQMADHADPLFSEFTYGDVGWRGRELQKLKAGSYVFFHTSKRGRKYITAYFIVDRVLETKDAAANKLVSNKYKNPHIREYLKGERDYDDDFVLFGDPILSRVFDEPLLFDRALASQLSLDIKFPANKSETQVIGSATRQWRKLTDKDADLIFERAERREVKDRGQILRSSEEVAETLERDIERLIIHQTPDWAGIRLAFEGSQRRTDDGRLDALFSDEKGDLVVVEIKLGRIGREAIEQTRGYMRSLRKQNKKVSGVVVCAGVMPAYEEELRKQNDVQIFVHGWSLRIQPW